MASQVFFFPDFHRIDDIEDSSLLRRGVPVAHHIFGVASTINSANYVYFLSLEKCLQLGDPRATTVFTGEPAYILFWHRYRPDVALISQHRSDWVRAANGD